MSPDPAPTPKPASPGNPPAAPGGAADATAGASPPKGAPPEPSSPPSPSASPAQTAAAQEVPPADGPELMKADLRLLEQIDCVRAVVLRFKRGRHPDEAIENAIARRLGDISPKDFQGNYPVRLLVTFSVILFGCGAAWVVIWAVGTLMGLASYVWEISLMMITLLAALFGIALTQPVDLIDERELAKAIPLRIENLRGSVKTGGGGRGGDIT